MPEIKDLKRRATEGNPSAQFMLGAKYALGSEVDRDYALARHWLRKAAEQGHMKAQLHLGHLHRHGIGVPEDPVEACKWYRLAAKQGVGNARAALGWAYLSGQGVEEDYSEAYFWFTLATYPACPDDRTIPHFRIKTARRFLVKLRQVMNPVELMKGELLLERWRKENDRNGGDEARG